MSEGTEYIEWFATTRESMPSVADFNEQLSLIRSGVRVIDYEQERLDGRVVLQIGSVHVPIEFTAIPTVAGRTFAVGDGDDPEFRIELVNCVAFTFMEKFSGSKTPKGVDEFFYWIGSSIRGIVECTIADITPMYAAYACNQHTNEYFANLRKRDGDRLPADQIPGWSIDYEITGTSGRPIHPHGTCLLVMLDAFTKEPRRALSNRDFGLLGPEYTRMGSDWARTKSLVINVLSEAGFITHAGQRDTGEFEYRATESCTERFTQLATMLSGAL